MERIPFDPGPTPLAEMPEEVARAVFGGASAVERSEPEVPEVSVWAKKVEGDGRMEFEDEDAEEQLLAAPFRKLEELFAHPELAKAAAEQFVGADWDEPLAKYMPAPSRQLDQDDDLQELSQEIIDEAIAGIDPTNDDESVGDFFARVDRELERMGHRPTLSHR